MYSLYLYHVGKKEKRKKRNEWYIYILVLKIFSRKSKNTFSSFRLHSCQSSFFILPFFSFSFLPPYPRIIHTLPKGGSGILLNIFSSLNIQKSRIPEFRLHYQHHVAILHTKIAEVLLLYYTASGKTRRKEYLYYLTLIVNVVRVIRLSLHNIIKASFRKWIQILIACLLMKETYDISNNRFQ